MLFPKRNKLDVPYVEKIELVICLPERFKKQTFNNDEFHTLPNKLLVGGYILKNNMIPYEPELFKLTIVKSYNFFDPKPYEKLWIASNGKGKVCWQFYREYEEPVFIFFNSNRNYQLPEFASIYVNIEEF